MQVLNIKRGQVYYADLSPVIGSEQGGLRPVLIIQNDLGNRHSPTTIVAAITSAQTKAKIPTHVHIDCLRLDSVVLAEQLRTIDKRRLKGYMATLSQEEMKRVDEAIQISMGV